jgi:hypothetical protein
MTLRDFVDALYLPVLVTGTLFLCAELEALLRAWVAYRRR